MTLYSLIHLAMALAGAPLLLGIVNRVKAKIGGRTGQPLLQLYYDLAKLLRKGAVYSETTTWVFRAGPLVGLAAVIVALLVVPLGGLAAVASFSGDLVLLAYMLGLMRLATVLAALDTGSAFEGMGASREVQFAALAEPAMLLGLASLAALTGKLSLSAILAELSPASLPPLAAAALLLVAAAVFIVLLAENSRIPFDDPNTHLELTMVHEVMVLDHGGPDLAAIQYGAALKLWAYAAVLSSIAIPIRTAWPACDLLVGAAGVVAIAVAAGLVESGMARLRMLRVPQLLLAAVVLSLLALVLVLR
ncbi:MAG: NADH-quinone oxidoreductase subunit H [Planctomycetaceae bacterium]|nr:NADH-quinone oxidoreductase subunit H [Planctomycetaceae bacterium]